MPSRQDQLHSHQFTVQRVGAALVARETDPEQSPFRRVAGATLAGALLAVLGLAGAVAYSVLTGGTAANWRDTGAVIIEKESGARYVYLDGRLHPVLNYTSALLIVGTAQARTVWVPRATLAGAPRGVPLGIPGAPDSLPARERLLGQAWTVCSRPARDPAGVARPESLLLVGGGVTGGRPLGDPQALLVAVPQGEEYLLWNAHRYRVREPQVVLTALGGVGRLPVPVAAALVNVVPAGVDLDRIEIANRGRPSTAVRGARVGQVFVVTSLGGERQYVVARADALAPVTELEAGLILADPQTASATGTTEATPLSAAEYSAAPKAVAGPAAGGAGTGGGGTAALPATTPKLATADTVCAAVPDAGGPSELRVDAELPVPDDATAGSRGGGAVDRVVVPPGRGALVEALASSGAPAGAFSVVTDLGVRFPVAAVEVFAMLGYSGTPPVRMPAELVALLPVGRVLDPVAARMPVP